MKKRNYLYLFFAFCNIISIEAFSQNKITTSISEIDLGAWAYQQHLTLIESAYQIIESDKINVYQNDKNQLFDSKKRKNIFKQDIIVWIQTDPNNLEIGFDSMISTSFFDIEHFKNIIISKSFFQFNIKTEKVLIKREDLFKLLKPSTQKYIEYFTNLNELNLVDIPKTSRVLMHQMNLKLRDYALQSSVILYKNDSLTSFYSLEEKKNRAIQKKEITLYNGNDQQNEYDTTLTIDPFNINNNQLIRLFILVNLNNYQLQNQCLAASLVLFINDMIIPPLPFGFTNYNESIKALSKQKELFEEIYNFTLIEKISYNQWSKKEYIERFSIMNNE
jgi:hypothetical protein